MSAPEDTTADALDGGELGMRLFTAVQSLSIERLRSVLSTIDHDLPLEDDPELKALIIEYVRQVLAAKEAAA
jgi:hypothetical protein